MDKINIWNFEINEAFLRCCARAPWFCSRKTLVAVVSRLWTVGMSNLKDSICLSLCQSIRPDFSLGIARTATDLYETWRMFIWALVSSHHEELGTACSPDPALGAPLHTRMCSTGLHPVFGVPSRVWSCLKPFSECFARKPELLA